MTTPNDHGPEPRTIELEVEVPGTPEQVWEAIATGQGIAAREGPAWRAWMAERFPSAAAKTAATAER